MGGICRLRAAPLSPGCPLSCADLPRNGPNPVVVASRPGSRNLLLTVCVLLAGGKPHVACRAAFRTKTPPAQAGGSGSRGRNPGVRRLCAPDGGAAIPGRPDGRVGP